MLSCLIIDDEPLAREVLAGYIATLDELQLLASFNNAFDALEYLQHHTADILLLDIQMPEMNGIDFLKSLEQPPITVFTTAFRDYAFEGFELGVIDFLLKPISKARFQVSVEKIKDFLSLKAANAALELSNQRPEFIFVKSGVKKIKLFFAEVTHIQGLKDYAIIHAASGKIVTKGSIKFMEELFPAHLFIRVHKSFIVSKNKVKHIEKNKIIINDHHIPIGRSYKEALIKQINRII
ncbi:LytR/AlgR family response regulator transcription factor [Chitinophaga defluvii]|uniref:LytTR family DNA-binding domain-containing protein n=1 Tax=Chitinophaga defluvii TaxID=3163343 RepID=A0ABV2TAN4_9BACT